jgi:hypothetical protein
MAAEALTIKPQHDKRFLMPSSRKRLPVAAMYVALGLSWAFLAWHGTSRLHNLSFAALYILLGIHFFAGYRAMWWELRPEGIFERKMLRTRFVRYSDITIVGHWDGDPDAIEVRYGSLDPNIFPQGSLTVLTSDCTEFLSDLRRLAPTADFRL